GRAREQAHPRNQSRPPHHPGAEGPLRRRSRRRPPARLVRRAGGPGASGRGGPAPRSRGVRLEGERAAFRPARPANRETGVTRKQAENGLPLLRSGKDRAQAPKTEYHLAVTQHDMVSELRQTRPFALREEELFLSLIRTVDVL